MTEKKTKEDTPEPAFTTEEVKELREPGPLIGAPDPKEAASPPLSIHVASKLYGPKAEARLEGIDPADLPALTALSPTAAVVGDPDFTLTATGTKFLDGSVINFGGTPLATTFVSETSLTATVPTAGAVVGAVPVTVNTASQVAGPIDFTFSDPIVRGANAKAKAGK